MAREIEAKARCSDLAAVRKRLAEFGARAIQKGFERNVVFDTPEGTLRSGDSLLRLREYSNVVLTFKGPRRSAADPIKSRDEIEVEVGDFDRTAEMLAALGFVKVWAYEKQREEWLLGDAKVCLDTLPAIGDYVEVEAPEEAEVRSVLAKLGVDERDVTPHTYAEIFREFAGATGWEIPDMVFQDKGAK